MRPMDKFLLALLVCWIGWLLLRDPKCQHGCKTVAQHLFTDGLDRMIALLLA
jgi:hypothetical protein